MDISSKIRLIEETNKKIDQRLNQDYSKDVFKGKSNLKECNEMIGKNQKLVSNFSL